MKFGNYAFFLTSSRMKYQKLKSGSDKDEIKAPTFDGGKFKHCLNCIYENLSFLPISSLLIIPPPPFFFFFFFFLLLHLKDFLQTIK